MRMRAPPEITRLWLDEYCPKDICCLCGNSGVIDTRGKVFSPRGEDVGAEVFCLCPNGRARKHVEGEP